MNPAWQAIPPRVMLTNEAGDQRFRLVAADAEHSY